MAKAQDIEAQLDQVRARRQAKQAELDKLRKREKALKARQARAERKKRTHALIELGAALDAGLARAPRKDGQDRLDSSAFDGGQDAEAAARARLAYALSDCGWHLRDGSFATLAELVHSAWSWAGRHPEKWAHTVETHKNGPQTAEGAGRAQGAA